MPAIDKSIQITAALFVLTKRNAATKATARYHSAYLDAIFGQRVGAHQLRYDALVLVVALAQLLEHGQASFGVVARPRHEPAGIKTCMAKRALCRML